VIISCFVKQHFINCINYIASYDRMMNGEGCERMSTLKYYIDSCLEILSRTTNISVRLAGFQAEIRTLDLPNTKWFKVRLPMD